MIRKAADGAKLARHPASIIRTCLVFLIAVKLLIQKKRGVRGSIPRKAQPGRRFQAAVSLYSNYACFLLLAG